MKQILQAVRHLTVCAALWLVACAACLAVDRVKLTNGSQQTGDIASSTSTELTLEIGATRKQLPVNEIESIQFEGEPTGLTQARHAIAGGRYADAASQLAKVPQGDLKRPLLNQEVQFYQALTAARLALDGNGSIPDAGKRMLAFERGNPTSFHYFEACEALGDLLVAMGNYPVAESYYTKVASAPWPEYKLKAAALTGRALVGQKKYDQAIARFDQVLASELQGSQISAQKIAATLGKAEALSGSNKPQEAVALVDEVIGKAGPEDDELLARAYTVKGASLQAAGQVKPAIVAYLHVDLLYPRFPAVHAEALGHLVELFTADNKTQRAAQARSTLKQKYPQSAWANR
jgi:tetratricopeptide (TPR) repeat protein